MKRLLAATTLLAIGVAMLTSGCGGITGSVPYNVSGFNNSKERVESFVVSLENGAWAFDFGPLDPGKGGTYQGDDLPSSPSKVDLECKLPNGTVIQKQASITVVPPESDGVPSTAMLVVDLQKDKSVCAELQQGEVLGRPTTSCGQ